MQRVRLATLSTRLTGQNALLPLAAIGLAALLPWRAAVLLQQWDALSPVASAAAQTMPAAPTPAAPTAGNPAPVPTTDAGAADTKLLAEVARRKADLDRREAELQTRAAQVAAAEQLARKQVAELTQLRQELDTIVTHEVSASDADLNLLVGLYSNMKPVQAAVVLGKLDAPKAAAILQRLDTKSAGPILAAMDPAAALAITVELEQRHAAFRK